MDYPKITEQDVWKAYYRCLTPIFHDTNFPYDSPKKPLNHPIGVGYEKRFPEDVNIEPPRSYYIFLEAFVFQCSIPQQKLEVDMQKNWTIYVSAKEKFEVLFPSQVIREHKGWFSDNGTSPGTVMYYSKIDTLLYQINVTRIRKVFGPASNYLKLALGEQLKSIDGAELEYDTLTIFKGYPALEYEMEIKSSKLEGVMVLIKNTLYNLFVVFLPGNETEFGKFVNSFEVVK